MDVSTILIEKYEVMILMKKDLSTVYAIVK